MKKRLANKKTKNHVTNTTSRVPGFLIVVLGLLMSAIVYMTILTATSGARLSYMESEERKLMEENRHLGEELIMQSSLTAISDSAKDLGFQKPVKVVYTTTDEVVAKLP